MTEDTASAINKRHFRSGSALQIAERERFSGLYLNSRNQSSRSSRGQ
jgi:hypothetical protein